VELETSNWWLEQAILGCKSIGMHPSTEIGLMEVGGCCLIGVS